MAKKASVFTKGPWLVFVIGLTVGLRRETAHHHEVDQPREEGGTHRVMLMFLIVEKIRYIDILLRHTSGHTES